MAPILSTCHQVHHERITKLVAFSFIPSTEAASAPEKKSGKASRKENWLIAGCIDSRIKVIDLNRNFEVLQDIDNKSLAIRNLLVFNMTAGKKEMHFLLALSISGDIQVYELVHNAQKQAEDQAADCEDEDEDDSLDNNLLQDLGENVRRGSGGAQGRKAQSAPQMLFVHRGELPRLSEPVSQISSYPSSRAEKDPKRNIIDDYLVLSLFSGDIVLYSMRDYITALKISHKAHPAHHLLDMPMENNLHIRINSLGNKRSTTSDFISQIGFTRVERSQKEGVENRTKPGLKFGCHLICTSYAGIVNLVKISFQTVTKKLDTVNPAAGGPNEQEDYAQDTEDSPNNDSDPLKVVSSDSGPSVILGGQLIEKICMFSDNVAIRTLAVHPLEPKLMCLAADNGVIKFVDSHNNSADQPEATSAASLAHQDPHAVISQASLASHKTLVAKNGIIADLVFAGMNESQNALLLCSVDESSHVSIWNTITNSCVRVKIDHVAHALAYCEDKGTVYAGDENGTINPIQL